MASAHALLFRQLAVLGAVYVVTLAFRLLAHLALLLRLRRPTDLRRRYGAWAVVTGPTSGIGRSMALELARLGLNIVLVGRDPAKLHDISQTISATHAVETKSVVLDLAHLVTSPAMRQRLREAVAGLTVGVLVNNAGVATPQAVHLHEADVEAWALMVRVNLWALTEVTAAVLPGMVERGRGAVVNIGSGSGSIEALPSSPLYSVYAASKRYVAHFSRSLYVEYRSKGIHVQCQAPLFVETKMTSDIAARRGLLSRSMVSPDAYARAAAHWIGHGPLYIPNLSDRLQWCVCCFVPDRLLLACLSESLRHRALFYR